MPPQRNNNLRINDARAVGLSVLLTLTPAICVAEAGEVGGAIDFALDVLAGVVGWSLLTGVVFWLLRKASDKQRVGLTLLFLFAPVIVLFGWGALEQFQGEPGHRVDEMAKSPVVLAGATFPAGSDVRYEQEGGGYWHKHPVGAQSKTAVMLGALAITGLQQLDAKAGTWSIALTRSQTIDGWLCNVDDGVVMKWARDAAQPQLEQCGLAASRTIDAIAWPARTRVGRDGDGSWALSWNSVVDEPPAKVLGIPFGAMRAAYSPALVLKAWSANFSDSNTKVGDYTFSSDGTADAVWVVGGGVRIEGRGQNVKTGGVVDCVLIQAGTHRLVPCKRHAG